MRARAHVLLDMADEEGNISHAPDALELCTLGFGRWKAYPAHLTLGER
jgi:hypothetical protein